VTLPLQIILYAIQILSSLILGILTAITQIINALLDALSPGRRRLQSSRSLNYYEGMMTAKFGGPDSPSELSDILEIADKGLTKLHRKAELVEDMSVDDVSDQQFEDLTAAINSLIGAIISIITGIIGIILAVINIVLALINAVINIFIGIINFIFQLIQSILGGANANAVESPEDMIESYQVSFGGIAGGVADIFGGMITTITSMKERLQPGSESSLNPFVNFVLSTIGSVSGLFIQVADGEDDDATCQMQAVACKASSALENPGK
jgi:hypothetical protein